MVVGWPAGWSRSVSQDHTAALLLLLVHSRSGCLVAEALHSSRPGQLAIWHSVASQRKQSGLHAPLAAPGGARGCGAGGARPRCVDVPGEGSSAFRLGRLPERGRPGRRGPGRPCSVHASRAATPLATELRRVAPSPRACGNAKGRRANQGSNRPCEIPTSFWRRGLPAHARSARSLAGRRARCARRGVRRPYEACPARARSGGRARHVCDTTNGGSHMSIMGGDSVQGFQKSVKSGGEGAEASQSRTAADWEGPRRPRTRTCVLARARAEAMQSSRRRGESQAPRCWQPAPAGASRGPCDAAPRNAQAGGGARSPGEARASSKACSTQGCGWGAPQAAAHQQSRGGGGA